MIHAHVKSPLSGLAVIKVLQLANRKCRSLTKLKADNENVMKSAFVESFITEQKYIFIRLQI